MALLLKRELVIMKAENSVFIHIHETYLTMNINSKCLKPGSKQKWKLLQVGEDTQIDNIQGGPKKTGISKNLKLL